MKKKVLKVSAVRASFFLNLSSALLLVEGALTTRE